MSLVRLRVRSKLACVSSTLDPTSFKPVSRSVGGPAGETPPNPHLPPLIKATGITAPQAPAMIEETGVEQHVLTDLALKLCNTVPRLTSEWAAQQLRLPLGIV